MASWLTWAAAGAATWWLFMRQRGAGSLGAGSLGVLPLDTQLKLIALAQRGDAEAMKLLVEENQGFLRDRIIRSLTKTHFPVTRETIDDLVLEAIDGYQKAIRHYRPGKGGPTGRFIATGVDFKVLSAIGKLKRQFAQRQLWQPMRMDEKGVRDVPDSGWFPEPKSEPTVAQRRLDLIQFLTESGRSSREISVELRQRGLPAASRDAVQKAQRRLGLKPRSGSGGRPPTMDASVRAQVIKMREAGWSYGSIAKHLGLKRWQVQNAERASDRRVRPRGLGGVGEVERNVVGSRNLVIPALVLGGLALGLAACGGSPIAYTTTEGSEVSVDVSGVMPRAAAEQVEACAISYFSKYAGYTEDQVRAAIRLVTVDLLQPGQTSECDGCQGWTEPELVGGRVLISIDARISSACFADLYAHELGHAVQIVNDGKSDPKHELPIWDVVAALRRECLPACSLTQ